MCDRRLPLVYKFLVHTGPETLISHPFSYYLLKGSMTTGFEPGPRLQDFDHRTFFLFGGGGGGLWSLLYPRATPTPTRRNITTSSDWEMTETTKQEILDNGNMPMVVLCLFLF